MRAQNVGILAIETYFPSTYVAQEDLETYSGASKGKYTIGLGQKNMAFVESYEDVNSLALTVVQNTLEKYNIDPRRIGRLEVGTETLIDKSKSTKTVLMQLFSKYGNHDIEGITTINACYGGTAALFNTIAWVESSAYDGHRLGCVVTTDVAVYKKGNARPTGGAGAICMIIGPNATFVIEPIRSSFLDHVYDFYKPDPRSEYPTVDGHMSINTYLDAIDKNYKTINEKYRRAGLQPFTLANISFGCFHAPFGKMVQKAYTRVFYNDLIHGCVQGVSAQDLDIVKLQDYHSKPVQEVLNRLAAASWSTKVKPSLVMGANLGNTYTGSLYAGLISLISDKSINMKDQRVLMFSYGSGLASSMFLLRVDRDYSALQKVVNLSERLQQRVRVSPDEYDRIMADREKAYGTQPTTPAVNFDRLIQGSFFVSGADNMWRKSYSRIPQKEKSVFSSSQIEANNCSSSNNSRNVEETVTHFVLDESAFNDHRARLTTRLQQFRQQIVGGSPQHAHRKQTEGSPKKRSHSSDKTQNAKLWAGFYKKTLHERLDQIQKVEPSIDKEKFMDGGLTLERAELMVENCIGKISIPLGLGLNFKINNKYFSVPMATEEPSVIAAASSAAKFIDENGGGLTAYSTRPIMIGQIQILDADPIRVAFAIDNHKERLIRHANEVCVNMVNRGGGVKDLRVRSLDSRDKCVKSTGEFTVDQMSVVDCFVNVCDSMGANIINTILEHLAPLVEEVTGGRAGLKILSNLCTERRAIAEFNVPVSKMAWKDATGEFVAKRMIEGYRFAQLDPYRASTHNKGIFNGMDAVALATGQDWRSIESSCHTYASTKNPKAGYQPLTHYEMVKSKTTGELMMHGVIEIPISVGSQGGVLNSNPLYYNNMKLLGFPNAQILSEIIASVGLCQNFAALRALAVEGIQKGHMNLHARNIAISGGVPTHLVEEATRFMRSRSKMNIDTAKAFLNAHHLFEEVRQEDNAAKDVAAAAAALNVVKSPLSTFYVELDCQALDEPIVLHVALDCQVGADNHPIHLAIESSGANKKTDDPMVHEIQDLLFGPKGYEWLQQIFAALEVVNLNLEKPGEQMSHLPMRKLVYKLKLIVIIIDLLTTNILSIDDSSNNSVRVINQLIETLQQTKSSLRSVDISKIMSSSSALNASAQPAKSVKELAVKYGLTLLTECLRVFEYNIDSTKIADEALKSAMLTELKLVLQGILNTHIEWRSLSNARCQSAGISVTSDVSAAMLSRHKFFTESRQKRLCATMMLLCDCVHIGMGSNPVKNLEIIRQLGSIYELEITVARDLYRWSPSHLDELNLYTHWLAIHNKTAAACNATNSNSNNEKNSFVQYHLSQLRAMRMKLYPMLDEKLRILADFTSDVVRQYYLFNESSALTPSL